MGFQNSAHQDAGSAAPRAGLDEVARHPFTDHRFDALAQVSEPRAPDHGVRPSRPVATELAHRRIVVFFDRRLLPSRVAVAVYRVGQTPLHQPQIEPSRNRGGLESRGHAWPFSRAGEALAGTLERPGTALQALA